MSRKINIGIVAHVDAGKTTITEKLLHIAGVTRVLGRVDKGNTVTDSMSLEKSRGISIKACTVGFDWKGVGVNIIDTPGHVDFVAEVERSLMVLDGAVLVISAKEGVQSHTKVLFQALKKLGIPTIFFVNKVDRDGVDIRSLLQNIKSVLIEDVLPLQSIEISDCKEIILRNFGKDERYCIHEELCNYSLDYLEEHLSAKTSVKSAEIEISRLFNNCETYPLLYGSALRGIGVDDLLNWATTLLVPKIYGDLSAKVYKVDRDDRDNRRCYVRVFGGNIELRNEYSIANREGSFKVKNLEIIKGAKTEKVDCLKAGDVGVIYTDELCINDAIGTEPYEKRINVGAPTLKARIDPKTEAQRRQLLDALVKLKDEDPYLGYSFNEATNEIELLMFGTVQGEVILDTLKERFGVEAYLEKASTIYMERPSIESSYVIRMYKETYEPATVGLKVRPLEIGEGFRYLNNVSFGDLKRPFQNAVLEGIQKGLVTERGWEVTDLEVEFFYSEFNSVDSTPSAYRKVAQEVAREAIRLSMTEILEPMYDIELIIPTFAIGKAISDISGMKGDIGEIIESQDISTLMAKAPVDKIKDYSSILAGYTQGKGVINKTFGGFRKK